MDKLLLFISVVAVCFLNSCSTPQYEPDITTGSTTKSTVAQYSTENNTATIK